MEQGGIEMSDNVAVQSEEFIERFRDAFDEMVVYKDLKKSNFISSFKLPSFMRDWVLKRFQDDDGAIDIDSATDFIKQFIPKKDDWKGIVNRVVNYHEHVRFLAKISVSIDIKTQGISFELPDFGLSYKDTTIPADTWEQCSTALLKAEENWGIVELGYLPPVSAKEPGKITLVSFQDFCPYVVDLDEFKMARDDFSLTEWIDIILGAVDYNAAGYDSTEQKLAVIQRLLPFVEKGVNLMELAPAGTGKSYLFGQISRHGWLVSGKVTRAKLIYDIGKKKDGVVAVRDYVALDEIREAEYMKDTEIQSALQAIMENGKYRAPDNHEVTVNAGIVFLGNISSSAMNEYQNMFLELPKPFHQPQFLDRIHGFIKGWDLPRMTDDLKVCGWALNSEYFATVMHELRDDPTYRSMVDELVVLPKGADTRDTEAVKRICTAYMKLLFPNIRSARDIPTRDFRKYCLLPAMNMRGIIRIQMGYADEKHAGQTVPDFTIKEFDD
jgi:ATP-dependent Lon protease